MNPPATDLVPAPVETVRLRLSGTPRLARGAQTLVLERKAAGALAWLALRGPAPRDRLALLLWPQASTDAARASLRQLIYKLKRAMGCAIIDAANELSLAPGLQVDPAGEDAPGADLLEGCEFADCPEFAQWLEQARLAHRQRGVAAGLAAAAAAEQAGDLPRALVLARRVLAGDVLCEAAHRQVMRVLYLGGDRSAALAAAAACEAALQEGLGVAPAAETRQLIESLRGPEEAPGASAAPGAARPIPVTVIRPPRLIGRERERTALSHALAPGTVVLVLGEAGLGKSRLLADAVPAGALRTTARPGDAAVPFATLARLLRPLVEALAPAARSAALRPVLPDLCGAAPLPPGGSRGVAQDLQRGVVDVLAPVLGADGGGEGEGAVFVLDDLHHADDASVELLQAALDDDRAAPWCWVLASRPAEGGAAVRRFLGLLADEGRLVSVTLQPLHEAAVAELLVSLELPGIDAAALAPEMARTTGGNPLFVLETLKAMFVSERGGGRLPRAATLGSLIERRLRLLSAPALALARVAALAGEDFSTELALQVLGTPLMDLADAWAELEAAQVLRDQAFAHDLIFEATLASVPAPIRRHARGAIAAFLEPRSAEPARVAAHWIAAGQPRRAAPLLESAARLAEASARFGESHALFEQAAAAFDRPASRGARWRPGWRLPTC